MSAIFYVSKELKEISEIWPDCEANLFLNLENFHSAFTGFNPEQLNSISCFCYFCEKVSLFFAKEVHEEYYHLKEFIEDLVEKCPNLDLSKLNKITIPVYCVQDVAEIVNRKNIILQSNTIKDVYDLGVEIQEKLQKSLAKEK